jgi:hypothetical protein
VWVGAAHAGGWTAGPVAGLLVILGWWSFASPKARYGGPVVRPFIKVVVVAVACAALWASGHHTSAVALLVFSVFINGSALLPSVAGLTAERDG